MLLTLLQPEMEISVDHSQNLFLSSTSLFFISIFKPERENYLREHYLRENCSSSLFVEEQHCDKYFLKLGEKNFFLTQIYA